MSDQCFRDVRCDCGKRFGWFGSSTDRPPCPRCGDVPSAAEIAEEDAAVDAARQEVIRRLTGENN